MNVKQLKTPKTEYWVELIRHLDDTWRKKKRQDFSYPFMGKDFADLKHFARIFRPWGLMALWDDYLDQDNEFNRRTGFSVFQFTRQLPFLVDGPLWKARAEMYRKGLMGDLNPEIKVLTDQVINK